MVILPVPPDEPVESTQDGSSDSAGKIEELRSGGLYDILYHGHHEMGFFHRIDGDKAVFYCFDFNCRGDCLFFPVEEIVVVDHPEQQLAAIASAVCGYDEVGWRT